MNLIGLVKGILAYRGFIIGSVKREFQATYRNSMLGATWRLLNPLAMIIVYTTIFSQVMHAKLPGTDSDYAYSIYLCAGILTWGLFTEIMARSVSVFLDQANLIKKINFPRICLPIIILISAGINFLIIFGIFILFLLISGNLPGLALFAILPVLAIQTLLAIGLGTTLGVLNVFFRDTGHFVNILMQFWFWLTPIVYPVSILPEEIVPLIRLNPMLPIIDAYQTILVNGQWPHWPQLALPLGLALFFGSTGYRLFRRRSSEMVDEL